MIDVLERLFCNGLFSSGMHQDLKVTGGGKNDSLANALSLFILLTYLHHPLYTYCAVIKKLVTTSKR